MTQTPISLRDISFVRGGRTILSQVSFDVAADERWVVLGPNGSGKTSLVRIMALYEHPSSGEVRVLGGRLGEVDVRELRRRVGYASAALADQLRPELSARDVVMTARYAALEPWWHRYTDVDGHRALACLDELHIEALAERSFGTLSSGEQQRVLLARTLMNEPGVMLLDEPSARLDLGGREELIDTLGALVDDPTAPALVLVTHHVSEIPRGMTHALLLKAGQVTAAGPIDEVLDEAALSDCFGLPLELSRHPNGRFTAWARR